MGPLLALLLAAAPPELEKGPPPSELVKLYFIAGDLLRAQEVLKLGLTKDPKCKPMKVPFFEYQELAAKGEHLTVAQAKAMIADDRLVSPLAMGKITKPVYERFVTLPLLKAKARLDAGLVLEAAQLAREALEADPASAEAKAILGQLGADAGSPAPARDGGR